MSGLISRGSMPACICLSLLLVGVSHGVRAVRVNTARLAAKSDAEISFGCGKGDTCSKCLTLSPFMSLTGGKYCKWCPSGRWTGKALAAGATGMCMTAKSSNDNCEEWILGVTQFSQKDPRPLQDQDDALQFCPAAGVSDAAAPAMAGRLMAETGESIWSALAKAQTDGSEGFMKILNQLSIEVRRLNRFQFTNPPLFNSKFRDYEVAKGVAEYSWKVLVWGSTFIPVAGGALSLGLGLLTTAAESAMVGAQGRSQDRLVSKGNAATSLYFNDVTFGMIDKAYIEIMKMNSEQVRAKIQKIVGSTLTKNTGKAFDTYARVNGRPEVVVAKSLGHIGLFVGGFFTFGVTWVVSWSWGAADLIAAGATKAVIKEALQQKTTMLMGLARLQDESVWEDADAECDITDWYTTSMTLLSHHMGEDPCPDQLDESSGKQMARVCVRRSPFGNHKSKVEKGLFSPKGRCFPKDMEMLLKDGLPCLTHESCGSSYCHFDTRIQYFFSDHKRVFHRRGGKHVPIPDQLHSMQVQEVLSPNETAAKSNYSSVRPLEDFVGEYNSYEGVKYATTGTCATACPKSAIGHGDCAGLTLRDTAHDVHNEATQSAEYDFGITIPNRLMMGYSTQGYVIVGEGMCADSDGELPGQSPYFLNTTGDEAVKECAQKCWESSCVAFLCQQVDTKATHHVPPGAICTMYPTYQPTKVIPDGKFPSKCYAQVANWPLDIYQPWNQAWYLYQAGVKRISNLLRNEDPVGRERRREVLSKVRLAYPSFCSKSEDPDRCPDPEYWDNNDALNMLTTGAPLSAAALKKLITAIDPGGAGEFAFAATDKVRVRDLFADVVWGEAWQRFLGHQNVEEVLKEDESTASTLKADYAQKMQLIAVGSNLVMSDGVWDLAAAQKELFKQMEQSTPNAHRPQWIKAAVKANAFKSKSV